MLHQAFREGWPLVVESTRLPPRVHEEVRRFLGCGDLRRGFTVVRCDDCTESSLVAFSCKTRSFCPSCGARRAHQTALHLNEVLPRAAFRQWTLSVPFGLRFLTRRRVVPAAAGKEQQYGDRPARAAACRDHAHPQHGSYPTSQRGVTGNSADRSFCWVTLPQHISPAAHAPAAASPDQFVSRQAWGAFEETSVMPGRSAGGDSSVSNPVQPLGSSHRE